MTYLALNGCVLGIGSHHCSNEVCIELDVRVITEGSYALLKYEGSTVYPRV
jgi:hypothetical protein